MSKKTVAYGIWILTTVIIWLITAYFSNSLAFAGAVTISYLLISGKIMIGEIK